MSGSNYRELPVDEKTPSGTTRNSSPAPLSKPPTYYGDGPFEAEDDDDESESLLEKEMIPPSPRLAELGDGFSGGRNDTNTKVCSSPCSFEEAFLVEEMFSEEY